MLFEVGYGDRHKTGLVCEFKVRLSYMVTLNLIIFFFSVGWGFLFVCFCILNLGSTLKCS